jgi:general stress protein 26
MLLKPEKDNVERDSMDKHIERLLKGKIAFVGSEADGKPYIKAMVVARREGDNIFYFDSNNGSVRTTQWEENPNACVYFYEKPLYRGVMLSGTMEIINDMELKELLWTPSMKFVYKGGVTDPDYCVLKFTATEGRHYYMFESENFEI